MVRLVLGNAIRSNLLSLQNVCKLQDVVSQRLATGLKVNSALDNPSSFYSAQSLNNRAADLSALLDAMSQGVQTIKAASTALQTATEFLQQAKAEAEQTLQNTQPVIARVGTENELLAAVNSGKQGIIVLTSDITMSTNQELKLGDNQSLAGARYLDREAAQTSLTFNFSGQNGALYTGHNSLISDLNINYHTNIQNQYGGVIYAKSKIGNIIQNVNFNVSSLATSGRGIGVIYADGGSQVELKGQINIKASGDYRLYGLYVGNNSLVDVKADLNIKNTGTNFAFNIHSYGNSTVNILSGSRVNLSSSNISVITTRSSAVNIGKDVDYSANAQIAFYMEGYSGNAYGGNTITVKSNLNLNAFTLSINTSSVANPDYPGYGNYFSIAPGVSVSSGLSGGVSGIWQAGTPVVIASSAVNQTLNTAYLNTLSGLTKLTDTPLALPDIDEEMKKEAPQIKNIEDSGSYQAILSQYDAIINDSSYKGVNLLHGEGLKIDFNESRSSGLQVNGIDISSQALGLNLADWTTTADIENSVRELEKAIGQLRNFSSQFGNYYEIVSTRQNFTNNLITVLEEGADKLLLADMNEESANMLMLETRQNLAINALSLASQAAGSILKLF